jgi:hypothetical protein
MVYVLEGRYSVCVCGQPLAGCPGDVSCYPEGTQHYGKPSVRDGSCRLLIVQWRGGDGECVRSHWRLHDSDGRVLSLLLRMHAVSPPASADERELRDALLQACAAASIARRPGTTPRGAAPPISADTSSLRCPFWPRNPAIPDSPIQAPAGRGQLSARPHHQAGLPRLAHRGESWQKAFCARAPKRICCRRLAVAGAARGT